jgi:2-amino-4-hydroxy-6-hydroxymethyldihydropteridine diphosphokinase
MILVALGANLSNPNIGSPLDACERALGCLSERGIVVDKRSRWYRSAPVPRSDQPDFVNGVAAVSSALSPADLLMILHEIEAELGRTRGRVNQARVIDLDLLAHGGRVTGWPDSPSLGPDAVQAVAGGLIVPHPRLHLRAFVLMPLRDVAPDWRHPVSGQDIETMMRAISMGSRTGSGFHDQTCEPLI